MARIQINPERLARLEAGGWRAYYDRDWPRLIRLMVQLNQEQFHIPFPLSVVAAFHVARGSIAWAPVKNDPRVNMRAGIHGAIELVELLRGAFESALD